jgi:hypothetical protein
MFLLGTKADWRGGNNLGEQTFQTICKNFGDNPIKNVVETNGFELIHCVRTTLLRHQSNVGVVLLTN